MVTNPVSFRSQFRRLTPWPVMLTVVVTVAVLVAGASLIRRGWQGNNDSASGKRMWATNGVRGAAVRSLAVLPFSGENSDDFGATNTIADGELTNAVVAQLAAAGNLNITPQSAVLAGRMTRNNMLLAGHVLQVDAVLSGVVFRNDAEWLSLRLHLVSLGGGEVLWANTIAASRADLPKLVAEIAQNVLAGLERLKEADEYEKRARRHTATREAYQHYLQGRFLWDQRYDVVNPYHQWLKNNIPSVNQLEEALRLDPNFALPYVGLADYYKADYYSSQEVRRAEEYALRALALDPEMADAHATLGFIRMLHYWDWAGAEVEFKRALELDPDCVTAHQWYSLFHALRGNSTESIKEITRARELAPYSLSILIDAAEMQYYATGVVPQMSFNDTLVPLLHVLELHPGASNARAFLTQVYWIIGEYDRAVAVAGSDWKGRPQDYARHRAGPRKGTREFDDIPGAHSYQRAMWHAQLNQREEALDLLERAHRYHHFFIIYLRAEPFFKSLHDEPRYHELQRRVGLAP